jgi:hypothetical protein
VVLGVKGLCLSHCSITVGLKGGLDDMAVFKDQFLFFPEGAAFWEKLLAFTLKE